jgi:hypothetical protein
MADRRQEIWDRIRQTSREEVVLEEMIRLGFWPKKGTLPQDPADDIRRERELYDELNKLGQEMRRLRDSERVRRELRKKRMEESKKKQKETKERRERERIARADAWRAKKDREVVYLGKGVSGGLQNQQSNEAQLAKLGLPVFHTPEQLAKGMNVTLGELRFLSYHRKTARLSHYRRFAVPKKTGGVRVISAPMPRLKAAQHWILHSILEKMTPHEAVHGFRGGRSIVSNAQAHARAECVVNVDLKDFFPTIRYPRVKRMYQWMGYSESIATLLALICTACDVEELELDGKTFFVATSERRLPQGAPTSPAITNVLCQRLDRKLTKMASNLGYAYTRYADDLTFSSSKKESIDQAGLLLSRVRFFVEKEGLVVHEDKVRVQRKGRRREVTGLVVHGAKPAVPRADLRRFRAVLQQIEKSGPAGKTWGGSSDVLAAIGGFAAYVRMVDKPKGDALVARVREIHRKNGYKPSWPRLAKRAPTPAAPAASPTAVSAEGGVTPAGPDPKDPKKKWWKLW